MIATVAMPQSLSAEQTYEGLHWNERAALAIGIFEIPLQIDKYFMFHEQDAELGAVAGINISITTLCLAYLYVVWIAAIAIQPKKNLSSGIHWGMPMIAYLFTVMISVMAAPVPSLAVFDLALLLQAYALFFYLANRVNTKQDLAFCLAILAAAVLLQSLFIFGLSAMGDAAVGQAYEFGPLVLSVWDDGRPAGSVNSAVVVASLLAIMWLPVMSAMSIARSREQRLLFVAATLAGFLAILLTQTRGAIITIVLGAFLIGAGMAIRGWIPRSAILVTLLLALLGTYPMMRVIENRISGDDGGSAEARKHLGVIATKAIRRQPVFGGGAGNCHLICQDVANSGLYRSEWYYTVHCKYLVVWVETGIFGLLTFLMVLGSGIRNGFQAWRSSSRVFATIGIALAAAIGGHMVHMLVDVFNSRSQVQMLWVILGIAAAVAKMARDKHEVVDNLRSKLAHAS